jgi:hypothetical protein
LIFFFNFNLLYCVDIELDLLICLDFFSMELLWCLLCVFWWK